MGSEAQLQRACELAFAVAREDVEANPAVEPPGDMRSFLYLARLPRRAIAVAQQAIEDDPNFRSRVAARATENEVGRAGFLWLHRPMGWAPEFEELTRNGEEAGAGRSARDWTDASATNEAFGDDTFDNSGEADGRVPDSSATSEEPMTDEDPSGEIRIATVSPIRGSLDDDPPDPPVTYKADVAALNTVGAAGSEEHTSGADTDTDADAIESELTSLRGLVDRLAGERELVLAGNPSDEPAAPSADFSDEVNELRSDLETARHELTIAQSDLAVARQEREEAQRLQSDALRRQVELERELSVVREQRASMENESSETQASLISLEDRLKRSDSVAEDLQRERDVVQSQLDTMTTERNQLREDRSAIRAERDELAARLEEVREKTGGVDVGELTSSNRSLTHELEATSRELARMMAQVENYEEQIRVSTSRADTLKTEKIELSSRLADTELGLETTKTQHEALKVDSERLAAEVGTLRAERDSLQVQLGDLQSSLSDVLSEQADSRARNDADRKALNELRVERDVLLARMSDIEQADRNFESKIRSISKERDDLIAIRDDLVNERGQLRGEAAAAASTRSQLQAKIDELESTLGPLQTELQAERRQREELASRLLELDELAADNEREMERLHGERDDLRVTVERLQDERVDANQLRVDRDNLQEQLRAAEQRLDEETSRHQATVNGLQEQIGALEGERTSLEQRHAEIQSELNGVREDYEAANKDLAKARTDLDRDRAEREGAQAEFERRGTEFESQIDRLEAEKIRLLERITEADEKRDEIERQRLEAERQRDRSEEKRVDAERRRAEAEGVTDQVRRERDRLDTDRRRLEAELLDIRTGMVSASAARLGLTDSSKGGSDRSTLGADVPVTDPEPTAAESDDRGADDGNDVDHAVDSGNAVVADAPVDDSTTADPSASPESGGDKTDTAAAAGAAPVATDEPETDDALTSAYSADDLTNIDTAAPESTVAAANGSSGLVVPGLETSTPDDLALDDSAGGGLFDSGSLPAANVVDMDGRRAPAFNGEPHAFADDRQDDELDEISALISETVTGFEQGDTHDGDGSVGLAPPSVFNEDTASGFGGGEGEWAGGGRRRIDVPANLYDDEMAVAQFVVSSPDVVLLVDGDSVAKLGWPSLSVAQQRDALVAYLADLAGTSGANPDVVFDGRIGDSDSLPASRAVRIRLSTPPTEPTAALDELVSAYPEQWPIALVTDDQDLAASAEARGATILNNGQLLDLFIAQ